MSDQPLPKSEIILYQTEDGRTRLEVRLEEETVWLTQGQMADLFQTTKQNVSLHIQNLFEERELERPATVKESLTVQKEGQRRVQRRVEFYNLDVIIIVSLYLDFAELQARSKRPMTMRDWIAKLDDFMRISEREILAHAGSVTHEVALARAEAEFDKFRTLAAGNPSPVERHFIEAIEQVKELEKGKRPRKKKP